MHAKMITSAGPSPNHFMRTSKTPCCTLRIIRCGCRWTPRKHPVSITDVTLELGLDWLVNLDTVDFVGKEALLERQRYGSRFTLATFKIDDPRKPEHGALLFAVVDGQKQAVGSVNCSAWSETLGRVIGNASIDSRHAGIESTWTELDGEAVQVMLSCPPLLKFERARQVPAPI